MKKIDRRRNYYIVIDTETFGDMSQPHVYNIGFAVVDKMGRIYETGSYLVSEFWYNRFYDVEQSFYFPPTRQKYFDAIADNEIKIRPFFYIRQVVHNIAKKYKAKAFIAHNMPFDYRALNFTTRLLSTKGARNFIPSHYPLYCTMSMSHQIITKMPSYKAFCELKPSRITKDGRPRWSAEVLYQYVGAIDDFVEEHTALEDVLIEAEIFGYINRQKQAVRREWIPKHKGRPKRATA